MELVFWLSPTFPHVSDVSDGKESACSARDLGSICGLGGSLGEGNSNPLQYSCLENSMDRGAWRATESDTTEQLTQQLLLVRADVTFHNLLGYKL